LAAASFLVSPLATRDAHAQRSGYVVVGRFDSFGHKASVELFDRELHSLGGLTETGAVSPIGDVATDATLTRWIADQHGKLLRADADGQFLDPVVPGGGSLIAAAPGGGLYDFDPFSKLEALSPSGGQLWLSPTPSLFMYQGIRPVLTATGELWVGGFKSLFVGEKPVLWQVDPATGATLAQLEYSSGFLAGGQLFAGAGAPDGTVWWARGGFVYEPAHWAGVELVDTQDGNVLQSFAPGEYGEMGVSSAGFVVDARGRLLFIDYEQVGYGWGPQKVLVRHDPGDVTAPDASWDLEKNVFFGFVLGPTGEELFVVLQEPFAFEFRLCRLNLLTGAKSSVAFASAVPFEEFRILRGDPTGFVYANVTNRMADTDGDGARNGNETFAGSDPFDSSSRPDGPKIGISFTGSQAIQLTLSDADGLLDPNKGLDLATLSMVVEGYGEMWPALLTALTSVTLTADGTGARVIFGALPLPSGLKLRINVSVKDLTGATASDWQVTPPGEL